MNATIEAPVTPRTTPELLEIADRVLAPTYRRPDCVFVGGSGAVVEDSEGRSYLDLTSGIAVTSLGHGSPVVARALREAADQPTHYSNLYHSAPAIELAQALVQRSFADSVFFCNSGAEAVEGAIKFARKFGGEGKRTIVSCRGSFHGRTLGALAATDRPAAQHPFAPLPEGYRLAPWNDDAALDSIDETVAAVLVEPVQGEGGVRVADASWMQALRRRTTEVGALLVVDEIQCGLGRTGSLWAHVETGITPDLMTLAKPLGGGLPIGAILMTRQVADALSPGDHGTTFGGGPLVTRVALEVLRTIDQPEFLARVRREGDRLRAGIEALRSPLVECVRGRGMMLGIRLASREGLDPAVIVKRALQHGLLVVGAADHTVRVLPPLTIASSEIDRAVEILGTVFKELEGELAR